MPSRGTAAPAVDFEIPKCANFRADSGQDGQNEAVALEFRVLGPVELTASEKPVALGGSRPLIVLTGLLLRPNQAVSVDELSRVGRRRSAPVQGLRTVRGSVCVCDRTYVLLGG
jgi:hypothetical protein